jgi:glycosyltransferase involved in cell wall biosynthesis
MGFQHATFRGVPASFSSPYPGFDPANFIKLTSAEQTAFASLTAPANCPDAPTDAHTANPIPGAAPAAPTGFMPAGGGGPGVGYGMDLVGDSERYARLVVALTRRETFDVIHAHDWLTYPAGIALSKVSGKPLIVQVHSTEFDRAGNNVNQRVYDIERAGMHAADRVVAVSQFTKSICVRRYAIAPNKVDVVYNGIDRESNQPAKGSRIESSDRIVLFLGRITMQKGPEYFIAAAKRVLEKVSNVKFVLAGSGDMALRMIELAANMGIGHKVLFTGFLRGKDVDRVFRMADCYVMPSVSEPFGIAALEAISHDVPVILSKTSGASEVLTHVLKVDFWDIDEMANKIIAVLRHPPLSQTLRQHGSFDLHRLTWEGAAERCVQSYQTAMEARKSGTRLAR